MTASYHKKSAKQLKKLPLKIFFELTDETFAFSHVTIKQTVKELKGFTELETGIPFELQNLYYLDAGDLPDDQVLSKMDIVPNAVLKMEIWHTWKDLVESCCANDIEWLKSLGVTKDTEYKTPTSEYMLPKQKREWIQQRADTALFVACFRNHYDMARSLLEWGANINSTTAMGRSPLHVAAAKNNGEVINLLLENGADVDLEDANGCNPLSIAAQFGHKGCERRLFMFRWQQRAKSQKPQFLNPPMMEFQYSDSTFPKWKGGIYGQVYLEKTLPPGEFIGSAFNAPRRNWHRRSSMTPDEESEGDTKGRLGSSAKMLSYDKWLQTKEKQAARRRSEQRRQDLLRQEDEKRRKNEDRRLQEAKEDIQRSSLMPSYTALQLDSQGHGASQANQNAQNSGSYRNSRQRIDPTLTAYEQWLKDKSESSSGFEVSPTLLPYQQMIREFCQRKCQSGEDQ